MKNPAFTARSHIRTVVLCALLTVGLGACASEEGAGASAAATASSGSVVAPNIGVIDRSIGVTGGTTQGTAPASTTATSTPSTTTPSSTTTVATIDKGSPAPSTPPKPSSGSATLDWTPPTANADGSALTNLAGYTVYYGTSPDSMTQSVKITNPGLTAYTLSNLPSGTWYFAVTSYSSAGIESTLSGVVSTKI